MIHREYQASMERKCPKVQAAASELREALRAHYGGRGQRLNVIEAERKLNEAVEALRSGGLSVS